MSLCIFNTVDIRLSTKSGWYAVQCNKAANMRTGRPFDAKITTTPPKQTLNSQNSQGPVDWSVAGLRGEVISYRLPFMRLFCTMGVCSGCFEMPRTWVWIMSMARSASSRGTTSLLIGWLSVCAPRLRSEGSLRDIDFTSSLSNEIDVDAAAGQLREYFTCTLFRFRYTEDCERISYQRFQPCSSSCDQ
jgi:hypothetical protein